MITKRSRTLDAGTHRPITAGSSITSNARSRQTSNVTASMAALSPEKRAFVRQIQSNYRRNAAIMGATNTANIMAKPDFLELLPMFVQKLLILDVYGSVAMKSRQQIVPYFKFIAENTKGETKGGSVLSSPFVNRQGIDPNFATRAIKNEILAEGAGYDMMRAQYTPILPGSVTVNVTNPTNGENSPLIDSGDGSLYDAHGNPVGYIDYSSGQIVLNEAPVVGSEVKATYQYDNETVGPHNSDALDHGQYGAKMGKGYLQLDEFNLVAEAMELACYWSVYSAFVTQQEYGGNLGDIAKEAAFSELTAEINTKGFNVLNKAASLNPQFNWDASPVLAGSVVPSDYLNMFKLKLGQAAASIYQRTRLTRPNRLIVGSTAAEYIAMINGFQADNIEDTVGPYKFGKLDKFDIYVAPDYDPNEWVMCCKSNDIRRNSALFGEYMPMTNTDPIGLANASVQQGYFTMNAMKVVNPDTVVKGKILGTF